MWGEASKTESVTVRTKVLKEFCYCLYWIFEGSPQTNLIQEIKKIQWFSEKKENSLLK